jgi:selenocysteine lyase/cysteine desulfurase
MQRKSFLQTLTLGSMGTLGALLSRPLQAETTDTPTWDPAAFAGTDSDFWAMVRRQYPLRSEPVYFNTGGLGPATYGTIDVFHRTMMELQTMSETGHSKFEPARATVASFIGADPNELAFTRNATESNSIIAAGLSLKPGDEVIFESHAHPGGSFPWLNMQKVKGIKVKIFEPSARSLQENLDQIAKLITKRTKVIQLSHITAPTGIVFNAKVIADMAHSKGIWFHVDGAQSLGMIPIDVHAMGCDSYASSGHKWLGAPHETGLLYIKASRLDEVTPFHIGAYSNKDYKLPDQFSYTPSAVRHEYGTRNAATVVAIAAATEFHKAIGTQKIAQYGHHLATYLQEGVRKLPKVEILTPEDPTMRASMTTIRHREVPWDKLNAYFGSDHKLRTRVVTEEGLNAVRISTHIYNNEEQVDRVLHALRQL